MLGNNDCAYSILSVAVFYFVHLSVSSYGVLLMLHDDNAFAVVNKTSILLAHLSLFILNVLSWHMFNIHYTDIYLYLLWTYSCVSSLLADVVLLYFFSSSC